MEAAALALILVVVLALVMRRQILAECRENTEAIVRREVGRLDRRVEGMTNAAHRARVLTEHVISGSDDLARKGRTS